MKVEVLYVAECPSYAEAVKLVRDALAAQGVAVPIQAVLVRDAQMAKELEFLGSPTIRINGRDVAEETATAQPFALSCRLYRGSEHPGLPPVELVRRALLRPREGSEP